MGGLGLTTDEVARARAAERAFPGNQFCGGAGLLSRLSPGQIERIRALPDSAERPALADTHQV